MNPNTTTNPTPDAAPAKPTTQLLREKSTEMLFDVMRYAKEHREVARKQYAEFFAKHSSLAQDLRSRAEKALPKEEVQARVREVNEVVEKRLEHVRADLEKRYDEIEREIEETVERVFGSKSGAPTVEVTATASTGASPAASASESVNAEPVGAKKRKNQPGVN